MFNALPISAELLDKGLVVIWIGGNDVRDATILRMPIIIE